MGLLIDPIPNSPHHNVMRIVWQTVGRITNKILGVKGFKDLKTLLDIKSKHTGFSMWEIWWQWVCLLYICHIYVNLTLYTLTSVSIFSIFFCTHFLSY